MEKRVLVAVLLMVGVIVLTNILFPPIARPPGDRSIADSAVAEGETTGLPLEPGEPVRLVEEPVGSDTSLADTTTRVEPEDPGSEPPDIAADESSAVDTITVESPLYRLRFTDEGAALVSAELLRYRSYAPEDSEGTPVQLLRDGDRVLGYQVAVGPDTVDLSARRFEVDRAGIELSESSPTAELTFSYPFPAAQGGEPVVFRLTYRFDARTYEIDVDGRFEGIGNRGYTVFTSLGNGLKTNEANQKEDFQQLAFVANGRRGGIESVRLEQVEGGEVRAAEGGPFDWVAVKNKYFLVALIAGQDTPGFGGLIAHGLPEEHSARITASIPVPAGSGDFAFDAYIGPQDYNSLAAIADDLENVNPVGWRWLRPVIRPLVGLVMAVLTWMHETLRLAYGWVLILFGVLLRIVLFPLYQKSMRAQMAQMRVQPLMQEIREKHKDDPQKLQQEMVKLYKEHGINPLAGCLPMMLPFPVLITLFFVFQNTIEFRGVPFLWLPDLSQKDPYYIIPLIMGASMFLLSWVGQRGMQATAQTRMLGYGMPIIFTFLFANFPSGLNLYYATSNIASLPQQFYLARERKKAAPPPASAPDEPPAAGKSKTGAGASRGGSKKKKTASAKS